MVEGLNIPFDIPGNAEKQLLAVDAAVQKVKRSIQELNAVLATASPDKGLTDQANRATRAVNAKSKAIKQSAAVVKQQTANVDTLADAERGLAREVRRIQPTNSQRIRGVKAATAAVDKQKVQIEKLTALQKDEIDSVGRSAKSLDVKRLAMDRFLKKQNESRIATEEARIAQDKQVASQKQLDTLAKDAGLPTLVEKQKRLKAITDDQQRQAKEAAKIGATQRRDEERFEKRRTTVLRARRLAQRRREARHAKERQAELRREAAALRKVEAEQRRVARAQAKINKSGNRAAFIFRRLFGILAAFTAARLALRAFFGGITASIEFNKNIEQAQLGIASIFTAVGNVRDAMGNAVGASEALSLAQKEAARQTKLLRKDALTTAATFDQLLDTFQIGLAPGIAAGLDIDEIRNFTLRISQAATAIGLAQNQLAEEIRSILSGTIQARTTRIAVALGITNEDIRRAKEYGKLFEFLDDRFKAFETAGAKAMTTVAALTGRVKDAFLQLLGAAGEDFFERIKRGLQDTFKTLTVQTPEGFIEPSPKALQAFEDIFDGLEAAADHARAVGEALDLSDLQGVGAIIGEVIDRGTEVLAGIIQGLAQAAGTIRTVLQALGLNLPTGEIREITAAIVKWVALLFSAKVAFGIFAGTLGKAVGLVTKLGSGFAGLVTGSSKLFAITDKILFSYGKLSTVLRVVTSRLLVWGALFGTILLGVRTELERMFDIENLSIGDTVDIIVESFLGGFQNLIADIKVLWVEFKDWLTNQFAPGAANVISKAFFSAASAIPGLKDASIKALEDIYKEEDRLAAQRAGRGEDSPAVAAAKAERDAIKEANAKILADLIAQKKLESDAEDTAHVSRLDNLGKEAEAAKSFIDILDGLPLVVGKGTQSLSVQADVLQKIKDDLEALQRQSATERVDLTGTAAQQAKLQVAAQNEIFKSTKQINSALEEQQRSLDRIGRQRDDLIEKTGTLSDTERGQAANLVAAGTQYFDILKDIRVLDIEDAHLKQEIIAATERANFAEIESLTAKRLAVLEEKKQLELKKQSAIAIGEATRKEISPEALKIAQEKLTLIGQEESVRKDIELLTENTGNVEEDILQKYREKVRLIQQAANLEASRTLPVKQAELNLQRTINELKARGAVRTVAVERAEAEGRLLILERELAAIDEKTRANIEAAESVLDEAISYDQITAALENLRNLEKERSLELGLQVEELEKQKLLIQQIIDEQEGGVFAGFEQGLLNFADRFSSEFNAGIRIAENAVQGLADFISTEIAEAFDPSTDDTWKQRLGTFLREFSRLVLNELVKLAIAKAILGLSGGGGIGTGFNIGSVAAGGARGGRIRKYAHHMSHFGTHAQGLAGGGLSRPRGLHPSDTIPIWAAKGEYMQRAKAVRAYGVDVMEKINRISINPLELKALASHAAPTASRVSKSPGFQEGGVISEVVSNTASEQARQQATGGDQEAPLVGVVVADEETMGRLVDNGGGSLLRWLRANAPEVSAAIRT